jgi:Zn-dependent protease
VSGGGWYTSSWTAAAPPRRVTTSKTEILHLGVAYGVLTGCLLLVFSGYTYIGSYFAPPGTRGITPTLIVVAALAALTGFVAHEMAHKVVAQRLGFWAEFRASAYGLGMAVVTSVLGFIMAAPGATMVGGMHEVDYRNWGRTSVAGPMTNLGFAAIFYAAAIGAFLAHNVVFEWLLVLALINAWFGTFNLFPFGVLDGAKVFRWSRSRWAGALALSIVGFAVTAYALYFVGTPLLNL